MVIGLVLDPPTYLNDDTRREMYDKWLKWSKTTSRLFIYSNQFMAAHNFPMIYVHKLGEDMRFFADNRLLFIYYDCCFHHWSTSGLNYYTAAKLNWDPYADVDEIIDDYCHAGFGPAASAVRGYFDRLEAITTEIAKARNYKGWRESVEAPGSYFSDDVLAGLQAQLDEAVRLAGNDAKIKERIEFLRKGLNYVPISRAFGCGRKAHGLV